MNRPGQVFRSWCALILFAPLLLGACSDGDLFSPNRSGKAAQMALRAYYGSLSATQNQAAVNRIRLTVSVLPDGPTLPPVVVDVDPGATEWNLPIEVPANSTLSVLVELINVEAGVETVEFSGSLPLIQVTTGPQPPTPAIAVFPGPPGNLSVTAISIAPRDQNVLEGAQIPLTASVLGATNATVRWSSSNAAVASVDNTGLVRTLAPGSATISATAGRVSDAITVVVGARAANVVITPANPTATSIGQQITLVATAIDARNNPVSGLPIQWTVADPTVAEHLGGGVFRALRNGATQVTATGRQGPNVFSGTTTFTVSQQAASVSISPPSRTFDVIGSTQQFSVEVRDAGGQLIEGAGVSWQSSNPAVATVNESGLVTAIADGRAVIRAQSGNRNAEAVVTVARPASVTVSPQQETLSFIGAKQQLMAEVRDASGNVLDIPVRWFSQQPGIAEVDDSGLVTAIGDGTATIVAQAGSLRATVRIDVVRLASQILFDRGPFTLNAGQSQQVIAHTADQTGAPISDQGIVWTSANPAIARVSNSGVVTGLSEGTTDIIARAAGHEGRLRVSVVGTLATGGISGRIRSSATAAAISGALISLRQGADNSMGPILQSTTTDAGGVYFFESLAPGTYSVTAAATGYVNSTRNVVVETGVVANQDLVLIPAAVAADVRVILTWGAEPRDLDSHLLFTGSDQQFHIAYYNRNASYAGPSFAGLDTDITSGFGPETITIARMLSGNYTYFVHHFSGNQTLATSNARVEVYFGQTRVATFTPPAQSGRYWTVFRIEAGTLVPVNTIGGSEPSFRPYVSGGAESELQRLIRDIEAHPKSAPEARPETKNKLPLR